MFSVSEEPRCKSSQPIVGGVQATTFLYVRFLSSSKEPLIANLSTGYVYQFGTLAW